MTLERLVELMSQRGWIHYPQRKAEEMVVVSSTEENPKWIETPDREQFTKDGNKGIYVQHIDINNLNEYTFHKWFKKEISIFKT